MKPFCYRIMQLKLPANHKQDAIAKEIERKYRLVAGEYSFRILRQSLDARKKDAIIYSYVIELETAKKLIVPKKEQNNVQIVSQKESYQFTPSGETELKHRPIIIGAGPCGLFCGYMLAKWGYRPIIIERGESVDERMKSVENFWNGGALNLESNVQFGEGGAGTFSDGKLNTLIKDPGYRIRYSMEVFVKYGAPEQITYEQKPHIGTDLLQVTIKNMRNDMIRMGASFLFNTKMVSLSVDEKQIKSVSLIDTKSGEISELPCDLLVLALGHSARDTFAMLYEKGFEMEQKPFAVGVRVEHPQSMISESQYGTKGASYLPPAPYKVTAKTSAGRGVYSFCMCPGGYVVNASSEPQRLAVNGMSYSKRDGENANSAIIVTVTPEDFPSNHPLAGMEFQRELEEKAYQAGAGKIPVQTYASFCDSSRDNTLGEVKPQMKGTYQLANLHEVLPENLAEAVVEGMEQFGRMIKGFNRPDAVLSAIESRTSSPVRIVRNEQLVSCFEGVYPAGEGAGYAGGITSAAVDGIRVAEKIAQQYRNMTEV